MKIEYKIKINIDNTTDSEYRIKDEEVLDMDRTSNLRFEDKLRIIINDLTLEEFANKISTTEQKFYKGDISKYLKGSVKPTFKFFEVIQKMFNMDLNWLIADKKLINDKQKCPAKIKIEIKTI
jgi:hypothetical protein